MKPSEQDLIETTERLRREEERALDELTIARLRAMRLNALAAAKDRRRGWRWRFAGGFVAAGLALGLAGVLWFKPPADSGATPPDVTVADLDLLSSESPEFYSDLEFYRWLATQSDAS
jgi:hypothetical protein